PLESAFDFGFSRACKACLAFGIVCAAPGFAGPSAAQCVQTPSGLISWWPADNSPADAMGTNNAFVRVFPIPPYTTISYAPGKVGTAFNLSQSSEILVNNSPSLNFGSNADFSIEAWVLTSPVTNIIINPPFPLNTQTVVAVASKFASVPKVGGYELRLV